MDQAVTPSPLKVENLYKSFRSNMTQRRIPVLENVSFSLQPGEIFGFLGPNGAGKTTTMKCIVGLLHRDSGDITLFDLPSETIQSRKRLGFLPEHPYFYEYLTGREFLRFTAQLCGVPNREIDDRIRILLEKVGMAKRSDIKLRKFSKGMTQRIGLAHALVHNPDLIILDEPFSGLDPIGRKELRDIILQLRQEGKTVFFSSHIIQDMELICDRVAIMLEGKIRKIGALSDLLSDTVTSVEIVFRHPQPNLIPGMHRAMQNTRDGYLVSIEEAQKEPLIERLVTHNADIISVIPQKKNLEDLFMEEVSK
jgi:ABC-2 type transport system ATP-binding protein